VYCHKILVYFLMKRITIFPQNNLGSQKKGGCKSRQKKNLNPAYFISEFTRADDVTPLSGGPLSEGDYQRQVHKVVVVTFRFFRSLPCVVVYVAPWRRGASLCGPASLPQSRRPSQPAPPWTSGLISFPTFSVTFCTRWRSYSCGSG
jgi:hypothetical protein